jgi:hypothetical protein
MKLSLKALTLAFASTVILTICSCGGGTGANSTTPPATSNLSGVAASGAPISGRIFLKDSTGHESFVDTTDGTYTFATTGLTAPFMLKAQWSVNSQTQTMYSFATASGIANITPLTQVIVVAAAKTASLDAIYAAPAQDFSTVAAALPAALADVQKTLNPLLVSFGQGDVNPITGAFAANHTGMDALLDSITVSSSATEITVTKKLSGSLILQTPISNITNGLAVSDWTTQDAAVAYEPDVAVSGSGLGLATWSESVSGHNAIRTRFLDGTGTSTATMSVTSGGDSSSPRVVFDTLGNAILVWVQYQNGLGTIWSSRYTMSTKTWSDPVQISSAIPSLGVGRPSIGLDLAGNAILVWGQFVTNNHYDAWSARFDATQKTWTAPSMISDGTNSVHDCQVAVNANGQGLVLMQLEQGDGSTSNAPVDVWARTVTTAGVWGSATRINAISGSGIYWIDAYEAIAIDANGNGAVLFVQNNAVGISAVQAAMYSAATGWQTSSTITNSTTSGFRFPQLAFDGLGNAFAAWREESVTGGRTGSASRYQPSTGWGPTVQFADNSLGDVEDPHLAVDAAGNATIVWYQFLQVPTFSTTINSIRYRVDTGWGTRQLVSTTDMDGVMSVPIPRVASNASGQTAIIWGIFSN